MSRFGVGALRWKGKKRGERILAYSIPCPIRPLRVFILICLAVGIQVALLVLVLVLGLLVEIGSLLSVAVFKAAQLDAVAVVAQHVVQGVNLPDPRAVVVVLGDPVVEAALQEVAFLAGRPAGSVVGCVGLVVGHSFEVGEGDFIAAEVVYAVGKCGFNLS